MVVILHVKVDGGEVWLQIITEKLGEKISGSSVGRSNWASWVSVPILKNAKIAPH